MPSKHAFQPLFLKFKQAFLQVILVLTISSNAYADSYSDEYDAQAGLALINAQVAYDRGYTGAGVVVGVADTGIAINHPEFQDRGFEFVTFFGGTTLYVDPHDEYMKLISPDNFPIDDPNGHGSHVSGIIAARRDGIGMHGVAYDAKLVVAGIGDVNGMIGGDARVFFPYLIQSGARIINNSWGSESIDYRKPVNPIEEVNELGINEVLKTNTLLVWATGNDDAKQPSLQASLPHFFPELTANWVAVNALTLNGTESSYGNECGVAKDWCISAPGGDVISTPTSYINNGVFSVNVPGSLIDRFNALYHQLKPEYFPEAGGNYTRMSGTSMAAPIVSGALAVILQAFPYMTMEQIKLTMFTTATDIGASGVDDVYGWGLLNLGKAIDGPGQFTQNWEVDTHGYSSVWNNDIAGSGGLQKLGNGTLVLTGNNTYTGDTTVAGGVLSINGSILSNTAVASGGTLKGYGTVANVVVNDGGTLAPGNSPGTLVAYGNVVQNAGSTLEIEIDGTGTANGAGNYDRLILTGAGSMYTADGSLNPILRGITAPATNSFIPALGQGFRIVSAEGGVTGSYATFTQPSAGLMSGTRMDLVYGSHALTLYATPSSYSNLAGAGVQTNSTRQAIGGILETMRPAPGVRLAESVTKTLFDNLVSQSADNLPIAFDQLAGVGYAQLIGMNLENVRFINNLTMNAAGNQRRDREWRNVTLSDTDNSEVFNASDAKVWGTAIGLVSSWGGDRYGHGMHDTLGGLMGGVQKRINEQTNAGFSVAYANSSPDMRYGMGSGAMQNLQLMGYASKTYDNGFYAQGAAGAGGGQIDAKRYVSVINERYHDDIYTANLSAAIMAGWSDVTTQNIRYETEIGLAYLGFHHFGFNDKGGDAINLLNVDGNTSHSLMGSIGANVSLPFKANNVNWLTLISSSINHELADVRTEFDTRMLNQTYQVKGGAIGRARLNVGLSLTGQVADHTSITFNLNHQTAENWNATAATFAIKKAF